ncbi:MAG: outer membrane beta-barrel protein [Bacteroidales bacterium]|nr:outer membrane beta-barrel protein [Bacteroidales bacterium]
MLFLLPVICTAQQRISVGIQVGNNYNSAYGKDIYNPCTKIGYGVYTLVKYDLDKHHSIMVEPGINQLGFQIQFVDKADLFWTYHRKYSYSFNAFSIPVAYSYNFGRRQMFHLFAGGYIQYIYNSKVHWQDEGVMFKTTQYADNGLSDINSFALGWNAGLLTGIGTSFTLIGKGRLRSPVTGFANTRYFTGIHNAFSYQEHTEDELHLYREAHLTSFQVRVGISIPL